MINVKQMPKAYREVYEILKYIPKEEYNKIPEYIRNKIIKNMDISYEYEVSNYDDFKSQKMLKETECILAILYRDYWASKEEREMIIAIQNSNKEKLEQEKKEKYATDIFKTQGKAERENSEIEPKEMIMHKETIINKIINKIKKYFL